MKKPIHSWDLFDTLIGRRCGTPIRLFEEMARRLGDDQFVVKRMLAEKALQAKRVEYSLEDIYGPTPSPSPFFQNGEGGKLAQMEFELELENAFRIKRYADQLREDDIIVSDMYLSEEQLRALMEAAGIHFNGKIYVSCYGKHNGTIWEKVKTEHQVAMHRGDNRWTDLQGPLNHKIPTKHARTMLTDVEVFYSSISPELAYWVRSHRLEMLSDERHGDKLNFLQLEFNVPFLWAASHLLRDYAEHEGVRKLLFMSRDTCLLMEMFGKLFPNRETAYIYVSRDCLMRGSDSFFSYLNARLTDDACLVDICASGGSLVRALPRLAIERPRLWTAVFLPEPFRVNVSGIRLEYVTTNMMMHINNTHLEMLNYARHLHVSDVQLMVGGVGLPVFDLDGEYDMKVVEGYHAIVEKMLSDVPEWKVESREMGIGARAILKRSLEGLNAEGRFLRERFPKHLKFETMRKKSFLEAK